MANIDDILFYDVLIMLSLLFSVITLTELFVVAFIIRVYEPLIEPYHCSSDLYSNVYGNLEFYAFVLFCDLFLFLL